MSVLDFEESTDLFVAQQNVSFPLLLPRRLPAQTEVVSARWWAGGDIVEIHTRTETIDLVRGRITFQLWSAQAARDAGRPRQIADAQTVHGQRAEWQVQTADGIVTLDGVVDGIYVQLMSLFPRDETLAVAESLQN